MVKVTLLGDSIRLIGYGKVVPELLGPEFEVWQSHMNGRNAKYTLRDLFDYAEDMAGSRIIHWNNGLWDVCNLFGDGTFSSEEEYVSTVMRMADIMLARYDRVIFATTTPVSPANKYNNNSDIERFNALVVPKLQEKGVVINDLYSLVAADIDQYIATDTIHLSEAGVDVCARQVAEVICRVAKTLPDVGVKEEIQEQIAGAPV